MGGVQSKRIKAQLKKSEAYLGDCKLGVEGAKYVAEI
jgi:hypothetical protein